jgi:pseudouridine kinase
MDCEVVCIGGANMDIRAKAADRLLPHASNSGTMTVQPGGVARNVAEGLARLGLGTALATAVGEDAFGRELKAGLATCGVDTTMVATVPGASTGAYLAVLDADGEMSVAVNAMDIMATLTPETLTPHLARIAKARFVFADCNPPAPTLGWLAEITGALIVDPISSAKAARLRELAGKDVFALIANRYQAESLIDSSIASFEDARGAADRLRAMGFRNVLLSLGRDGAVVAGEGNAPLHLPATARTVRDVTGAGDAASAGTIFGLCQDLRFGEAARLGQRAAAIMLSGGVLSRATLFEIAAA